MTPTMAAIVVDYFNRLNLEKSYFSDILAFQSEFSGPAA